MSTVVSQRRITGKRLSLDDVLFQQDIEQFLFDEAALLDERRYQEWFDLLSDDLEYWMPTRSTRARGDEANEFAPLGGVAFFDENKALISERIRKLDTDYSWSEDPPSRTRRIVANVRVLEKRPQGEVLVTCNLLLYRSRLARDEDMWAARREDLLRSTASGWQIARRHIFLDHVSLNSKNLSVFF